MVMSVERTVVARRTSMTESERLRKQNRELSEATEAARESVAIMRMAPAGNPAGRRRWTTADAS
ncbi:hypothetical protein [Streptomyces sp. NPDC054786]